MGGTAVERGRKEVRITLEGYEMPINTKDLKDVEEYNGNNRRQEAIRELLENDPGTAWTAKELSEKLDIPVTTVFASLYAMERKGLVARKLMPRVTGRDLIYYYWPEDDALDSKTDAQDIEV